MVSSSCVGFHHSSIRGARACLVQPAMAARILANMVKTIAIVSGRAFVEAYQEALKKAPRITMAGRPAKLTVDDAYKILGLDKGVGRDKVLEAFQRHFEANDPAKGGSFYIQAKIYNAKEALERAGEI